MQMKLQRQHFLLSYFRTLSDGPVGVEFKPPTWQPDAQPTEPPVRGTNLKILFKLLLQNSALLKCWSSVCVCTTCVVKTLKFVRGEILRRDHSSESSWEVLSCGAVYYAVQGSSNFLRLWVTS